MEQELELLIRTMRDCEERIDDPGMRFVLWAFEERMKGSGNSVLGTLAIEDFETFLQLGVDKGF